MVCDSALAKDVEPRFQIYSQGRHLEDKDDLLQQPRLAGGQQVLPDYPVSEGPAQLCGERLRSVVNSPGVGGKLSPAGGDAV